MNVQLLLQIFFAELRKHEAYSVPPLQITLQPIHNTQNGGKQRIEKRWKSRKQQARLRRGTAASDRVALLSGSAGE